MQPSPSMLLQAACNRLGFVYAEIWRPRTSANGTMLTLHATSANEDDQDDPMRPFASESRRISLAAGSGLPGRVWATRQPEWSIDVRETPANRFVRVSIAKTSGLAAAVGIPLLSPSDSAFVGVAVFFAQQRAQSTVQIMQALGNVGAMLAYHLTGLAAQQQPGTAAQQAAAVAAQQQAAAQHAATVRGMAIGSSDELGALRGAGGEPALQAAAGPQGGAAPHAGGAAQGGYPMAPPTALSAGAQPGGGPLSVEQEMVTLTEFAANVSRLVQVGLLQAGRDGPSLALEQMAAQLGQSLQLLVAKRGRPWRGLGAAQPQQQPAATHHLRPAQQLARPEGGDAPAALVRGESAAGDSLEGAPAATGGLARAGPALGADGGGADDAPNGGRLPGAAEALAAEGGEGCGRADAAAASQPPAIAPRALGGGSADARIASAALVSARFSGAAGSSPMFRPHCSPMFRPHACQDADDMALLEIDLASLVDFVESNDVEPYDASAPAGHNATFDSMLQKTLEPARPQPFAGAGGGGGFALPSEQDDAGWRHAEQVLMDGVRTDSSDLQGNDGSNPGSPGAKPRRMRKGKELSFADVSRHFDLPLTQAAERLNVCVTLVKRVCRENGVSRWPFRKLQSRKKKERIAREALTHGHAGGAQQQGLGAAMGQFAMPGLMPTQSAAGLHAAAWMGQPSGAGAGAAWPGAHALHLWSVQQ